MSIKDINIVTKKLNLVQFNHIEGNQNQEPIKINVTLNINPKVIDSSNPIIEVNYSVSSDIAPLIVDWSFLILFELDKPFQEDYFLNPKKIICIPEVVVKLDENLKKINDLMEGDLPLFSQLLNEE